MLLVTVPTHVPVTVDGAIRLTAQPLADASARSTTSDRLTRQLDKVDTESPSSRRAGWTRPLTISAGADEVRHDDG